MKIVSIASYPISRARHGGQRRVEAIHRELRRAGHSVEFIPIFFPQLYPEVSAEERTTALSNQILADLEKAGRREDLHLAQVLGPDNPVVHALLARLTSLAPQVILLEQPWLYGVVEPALAREPALAKTQLVYSSQNVETALINPVWQDETLALEQRVVRRADQVIAVSREDAAVFDGWRDPGQRPTIIAANGCWLPDPDSPAPARPLSADYALVTGSAHPPNALGYWDCIGPLPGFLPPKTQLAVVGGVNTLLKADPRFGYFRRFSDEFVHNTGPVSEELLTAFLHHAKLIALPVTQGGGTNLKTAEALMWLKPIVAMRPALRGYEEAEALSGVYVAESPAEFRSLLRRVMLDELGSERVASDVDRYGWPAQLAPMVAALERLGAEPLS